MENSALLDLFIVFTETFVDVFLSSLACYTSDALPGNINRKCTNTALLQVISHNLFDEASSTKMIGTKIPDIVRSGKKHREKSKIIAKVVNGEEKMEEDLIRILIGAALQVFWSFQFIFHGLDSKNGERDVQKMAVDAVHRSFNYIADQSDNQVVFNEDFVAKAILFGYSKSALNFRLVKLRSLSKFGGYKVFLNGESISTRELYEESLTVVIESTGEDSKLFCNLQESYNGYYRFPFRWEKQIVNTNDLDEVPVDYQCRIPIITFSELQQKFDEVFDTLTNRNIELNVSAIHKNLKDFGEIMKNLATELNDLKRELKNNQEPPGTLREIDHNMFNPTESFTGGDQHLSEGSNVALKMEKSALLDLLIKFTETFVDIFLSRLVIYTLDAQPGNRYRKHGTSTNGMQILSSGATRGVTIALNACSIPAPVVPTQVIVTKISDRIGSGKKHREKSKIIEKLVHDKEKPDQDLIRILIGAAFQVFWSFQFIFHGLDSSNAKRDSQKMAVDAVNRSFNYIAYTADENDFDFNEDSIARAILFGNSKGIFAKLPIVNLWPLSKIPTGGHTVILNGKRISTRTLYEKSLTNVLESTGEDSKLCCNLMESYNGYYRFPFRWEDQIVNTNDLDEVPLLDYQCRIPIITFPELQQKFDEIFGKLKNRNIESKITAMHEDLKVFGEMMNFVVTVHRENETFESTI